MSRRTAPVAADGRCMFNHATTGRCLRPAIERGPYYPTHAVMLHETAELEDREGTMRPIDELTEQERWFEMACACMGCGLRRDPLPEKAETWFCDRCSAAYEDVPCFCCGAPLGHMGICDVCDDHVRD